MIDNSYYLRQPNLIDRTSAGGVVCRINLENRQLLFAVVREVGDGYYVLPKGGVEVGETLEEAAYREIGEEAGIHQLKLLEKLGARERMGFNKRYWSTTHFYLFVTDQVEFRPTDVRHNYKPEWWPLEKADGLAWPEQQKLVNEKRTLIKQLIKAEALHREEIVC